MDMSFDSDRKNIWPRAIAGVLLLGWPKSMRATCRNFFAAAKTTTSPRAEMQ